MSESRISIGYLDKDKIQLDLNRTEGTETISLDDLCTLIERHQWILQEAFELAKEKRIDRVREFYEKDETERAKRYGESHINDAVPYMKISRYGLDPASQYMLDVIDKNERDAGK